MERKAGFEKTNGFSPLEVSGDKMNITPRRRGKSPCLLPGTYSQLTVAALSSR